MAPVASNQTVTLTVVTPDWLVIDPARRHVTLSRLANWVNALASGAAKGSAQVQTSAATTGAVASGTLTLSTASGTVGGVINGVTITVTAAGGDAATAILIRNAINASGNALVAGVVTATATGAVVTVSTFVPGKVGNSVTFAASGTGVTASGSGRLTGGAGADSAATSYVPR